MNEKEKAIIEFTKNIVGDVYGVDFILHLLDLKNATKKDDLLDYSILRLEEVYIDRLYKEPIADFKARVQKEFDGIFKKAQEKTTAKNQALYIAGFGCSYDAYDFYLDLAIRDKKVFNVTGDKII